MAKIILSLDGGGIRGAATTQFLSHVEARLQKEANLSIRDCVDFYAGTSTGSIIALALATTSLNMQEINKLYSLQNAKKIFKENGGIFEWDGINSPKYETDGKKDVLRKNFGDARIGDVPTDKHVLAVSYEITTRKPVVFKSTKPDFLKVKCHDIADASSAAPTYFPTVELKDDWLIDGGVIANNPTMCAIAEAKRVWSGTTIGDLRVLSIGTGYRTRKINGPSSQKWGAIGWFTKGHILDVLTDEVVVGYQARTILEEGTYIRVNADMKKQPGLLNPPDDAMDDISRSNINKLRKMGDWWFSLYGADVVKFLLGQYKGLSIDSIDPDTGLPS
ncbi:patatin-like phospholipase family protein [Vibrio breoganii]|uniref:Patatin n=1 Tax=Vibrio breoganii TaxID=553239 RepID=A0AAP8SWV6_9VIBR|nr:patatin-like phospholipase family protein [Vibrio breoganii]PMG01808.1 patatin [Vibrio breoganii]PMG90278.1 patatin [Vibrio breoganii]PMH18720.1 patatin [Vibrio breoganii]PMJ47396.1 patatin [Vibrio breoganii]PMK57938.1 patatin [Vibrio breoganii]